MRDGPHNVVDGGPASAARRGSGTLQRMRRATFSIHLTSAVWLATLALSGTELAAENWPQWRGPSSRGVSQEAGLPTTWGASENLAWRAPLAGLGTSSPIVWGDLVIVTSQVGSTPTSGGGHPQLARDDRALAERETPIGGRRPDADRAASDRADTAIWLVVEAFRRSDGQRLWEYKTRATGPFSDLHEKHNLATPTPATDGQRVYAWFGNGQVVVLDMAGRMVWTRHLGEEYSSFQTQWGHGSSPTLHGDLVIFQCDHLRASYLLALDAGTGKERWKVDRGSGRVSHSTPLVVHDAARPRARGQLVRAHRRLRSEDGRAPLVYRQRAGRRRFRPRSSTTAGSS